jgi:hypothetical protein
MLTGLKIKNQIKRMRMAGLVACIGDRLAYRILVRRTERNRPLGRHSRRWENNFRMHLH